MAKFIIFIVCVVAFALLLPKLQEWFKGFMMRRAEDTMRRMFGMPSRKEEERARRQQQKQHKQKTHNRASADESEAVKDMQTYAEDVEFTEYTEYSQTEIIEDNGKGNRRYFREESQVSDAEFTEIKEK